MKNSLICYLKIIYLLILCIFQQNWNVKGKNCWSVASSDLRKFYPHDWWPPVVLMPSSILHPFSPPAPTSHCVPDPPTSSAEYLPGFGDEFIFVSFCRSRTVNLIVHLNYFNKKNYYLLSNSVNFFKSVLWRGIINYRIVYCYKDIHSWLYSL